ncbi:uroporphyrinogen-III C-methyltransferase [Hathewaya histolytica]|uniref:uroporphyrinogen-III C-methyltransferase n=1 Tax=Hathewaya histolytica TaxID=1498 RepID=A0A4V6KC18_HATHI|nr:uroporphyrinogen-III C-methyltransferase [Hathewaya histolytica]VTQ84607.1 uroporphyrinogen III synthase/methyltransferase [Hathewaya histolytica]
MKGKVFLVGAGPGDYKLLTLKGLDCVKNADVIVYDRLANEKILKWAKEDCEFIYVGKKSKYHTKTQDEINEIIAEEALKGKVVTRLKGGDPYVFGRGGEEGEFLLEKGVKFEVVPGITSAIGGLCYAGIPITHRDFASSFHVITGHLKEEENELNWSALAQLDGTLVFLMGVANLQKICNNLIKEGKDSKTSVAIVNWAARPYQRVVSGTLEDIYEIAMEANIQPPSLIVVGGVVGLRDKLNFYEEKPLFGKNVIVTRARTQSSKLLDKINDLGGNALEVPAIKIKEIENSGLDKAIENIKDYTTLVLTSENAVNIFFERLFKGNKDIRSLSNFKIACIGNATAKAVKEKGIIADLVPEKFVAESLLELLKENLTSEDKVLIPRAKEARNLLVDELKEICSVDEIKIYETLKEDIHREDILNVLEKENDLYVTFTSSSTVKNFIDILGKENLNLIKDKAKLVSIGPITSKTIENFGLTVHKEAKEYTIDGVVEAIIEE